MENCNIILRYISEAGIDDYVRRTTIETEWNEWDFPWEKNANDGFVERQKAVLNKPRLFSENLISIRLQDSILDGFRPII